MTVFTETDVRAGASGQSYERGSSYYRSGAVSDVIRRGNVLTARVQGSDYAPYEIALTLLDDGGIGDTSCTCPYDWGGYCKHIVAVLLTVLQGDKITVKPELDTLLAGLTEAQLRRIIRAVVEDEPALVAAIEQEVEWLTQSATPVAVATAVAPAAHSITFDLAAIRREMRKDFRRIAAAGGGSSYSDGYWDDDAGAFDPDEVLFHHRELAERLLAAGDAAAATDVITAVIEEWGEGIAGLDEWIAEANVDVFDETALDLGVLLAEALLSQDFSLAQRAQWLARVEDWGEDLINLDVVETALNHWWDYPPLVAAMQGNITKQGAWGEDEAPDFADELTLVRLRILERQGRTQAYIHLAEAEGQTGLYVNMLARSGQVAQAVAEARQWTESPTAILSLARVLVEQGERAAALDVAGHGLDMTGEGSKTELARWTVTLAQGADDSVLALRAAQTAFTSSFELADYQAVERLAGADWPAIKAGLLEQMARSTSYRKVDIYLYEHMLAEAMAEVDRSYHSSDLERVIQAARADFPDWGIGKCQRQAEGIMNEGKAKYYDSAVGWVRIAHDIYLQHDRGAEWQAYLNGLLDTHARKYKLVPMLRGIR
jgi:uncharacterized Zn finger protein